MEDGRAETTEEGPKAGLCCYVLRSTKPGSRRTYFGYTTDIARRLRQHNGEITGGAKQTRLARPWKLVAMVEGFEDERQAKQFEYRNHNPLPEWGSATGMRRRMTALARSIGMEQVTLTSNPLAADRVVVTFYEDVGFPVVFPEGTTVRTAKTNNQEEERKETSDVAAV